MILRLSTILREISRGGLAGLIAGIVIGGLGGRVVMTLAALLNPEATGLRTENGELIGSFTVNGTLALVFFGGMFGGIAAGMIWVIMSPWLPGLGWRRRLLAGPLAVALGGFFLVDRGNPDFFILGSDGVIVALLLGLVALVGVTVAWLDDLLDRRLPRPDSQPFNFLILYGVIAGIGLLFLPITVGFYFSMEGCGCSSPPVLVGWTQVFIGAVTATWWALRLATGRLDRPRVLIIAGGLGVAAAAIAGIAHLLPQVVNILSAA